MSMIVPQGAATSLLGDLLTASYNGGKVGLYKTDTTLGPAIVLASLTEATFTGYARATLGTGGGIVIDGGGHSSSTFPVVSFAPGSGGTGNIYGYFVTRPGGTTLIAVERFAAAPLVVPNGTLLQLALTFTQISEF